ncbi:MAG: tRNA (guanosine(46)-N7)-methyltransferase TrmB, partial [Nevskiales bacterium]
RYGLEPGGDLLDWNSVFGREAPRVLEIGFGNGESVLAQALARPEQDYLGIEVHRPGIGRLLARLSAQEVSNVRVVCADAVEILTQRIPPRSLNCVELYFPDPWPKTRHHKRRIVQPDFADAVARALRPGGRWLLATDWAPYAEHMREVLNAHAEFANLAADGGFVSRPPERLLTRFEQRGLKLGHQVFDLAYRRI